MSSAPSRIFLSRIIGHSVYDPVGDKVGKLRDVVLAVRTGSQRPRVLGLVVEVLGRRRVFVPITRVTSINSGNIIITGVLNLRRFQKRSSEVLVIHEMLDREVSLPDGIKATLFDAAIEQAARRDWFLSTVAVAENGARFGRRGATHVLDWSEVSGLLAEQAGQGATHLLATLDEMRPTDVANALRDLTPKRRMEIALEFGDERLAAVLEELPERIQVEILSVLDLKRGADVLEQMSPDDAADLLNELPAQAAEELLSTMEPSEAEDVRRLLTYEERTAGGMMTTEPVVLPPDATIAEALALVREPELIPALATMVYICRPPIETPTGRFLGVAHLQELLREPPSTLISAIVDNDIEWPRPEASLAEVASLLAAYNLVALPVVDENQRLVGAVTIDDVLDHLLPEGWRDRG